jgi:hypothetical protein
MEKVVFFCLSNFAKSLNCGVHEIWIYHIKMNTALGIDVIYALPLFEQNMQILHCFTILLNVINLVQICKCMWKACYPTYFQIEPLLDL